MEARVRARRGAWTHARPPCTRRYIEAASGAPQRVFACLFTRQATVALIAFEELFRGTLDGTSRLPARRRAPGLGHNAAAIVCMHNHPSGSEPSTADRVITKRLAEGLRSSTCASTTSWSATGSASASPCA